ncbi:MFS-type transporter pytF-like protein [Cladobotryum mycophilum]|uniref:MFS-type transporter pytF-like protein n=1 Tax=Cladobotryum mycophilum TaxID=491253 RepID=A0ABR0SZX4_9HYPO
MTMARTSIELQPTPSITDRGEQDIVITSDAHYHSDRAIVSGDEGPHGRTEFSLPPVDTGKDAWLFLAAAFVMEALVWGFPFAFGIFQDYYRTHEPFAGSSQIAIIGTCAMGIMYLDIPFVMALQRLYPKLTRYAPAVGLVIMCLALSLSSFSQTTTHLIITQGVFYAIGGSIAYCPCILYMDEWFVKRKGFAYGAMWSGTGLGGLTIPLVLEYLLGRWGFRTTLRIWAVALFVLTVPLVWFLKPRLPASATAHIKPFNLGFLLNRSFGLYQLGNVVEAVGYFLPGVFLPTYARTTMGAGAFPSALTLLMLNVPRDDLHTDLDGGDGGGDVSPLGSGDEPGCAVHVLRHLRDVWGAYTATWPGIMKHILTASGSSGSEGSDSNGNGNGNNPSFDPTMVFGFLSMGRGIGNVAAGPLSEALIRGMPWQGAAMGGYGSGYGTLIAFTGATAVVGGTSYVWRRIGWL